jgi:uncharacterized protein (DUF1697 family)
MFLGADVDYPAVVDEIKVNPAADTLMYAPGALVWNVNRENYQQSKLHDFIGKGVYKRMTARNVNTVRKLQELLHDS